ncbi:MAG TPA: hypothetical protein VGI63_08740, partial [Verrucomicrobiae bacterium]
CAGAALTTAKPNDAIANLLTKNIKCSTGYNYGYDSKSKNAALLQSFLRLGFSFAACREIGNAS